jgi:hypothetical protein
MGTVHRPDIFKMVMDLEPDKQDKIGTGEVQVLYPRGYKCKVGGRIVLPGAQVICDVILRGKRRRMKHVPPGVRARVEEKGWLM